MEDTRPKPWPWVPMMDFRAKISLYEQNTSYRHRRRQGEDLTSDYASYSEDSNDEYYSDDIDIDMHATFMDDYEYYGTPYDESEEELLDEMW